MLLYFISKYTFYFSCIPGHDDSLLLVQSFRVQSFIWIPRPLKLKAIISKNGIKISIQGWFLSHLFFFLLSFLVFSFSTVWHEKRASVFCRSYWLLLLGNATQSLAVKEKSLFQPSPVLSPCKWLVTRALWRNLSTSWFCSHLACKLLWTHFLIHCSMFLHASIY